MGKLGLWLLLPLAFMLGSALDLDAQGEHAIAIEHVTVIDGTGRPAIADATVLVEHGRIKQDKSSSARRSIYP